MGLDNGIILKTKSKTLMNEIPEYVRIEKMDSEEKENHFYEYDICYWRKCWDLRNRIFEVCDITSNDEYEMELSTKDIDNIIDIIISYFREPEKWESSIWSFDEMMEHLAQDIVNLSWLKEYIKNNSMSYCYFYDSY